MEINQAKAFLSKFVTTSKEVANGSIEIANIFSVQRSENLIGIFLFFLTPLILLPALTLYTTLVAFLVVIITVFAALAALVGGILGYKLITGQTHREIEDDTLKGAQRRIEKTTEIFKQIKELDTVNQELFIQKMDNLKWLKDSSHLADFSSDDCARILQKELLGTILERNETREMTRSLVSKLIENNNEKNRRRIDLEAESLLLPENIKIEK